jgi:hypothetical protein
MSITFIILVAKSKKYIFLIFKMVRMGKEKIGIERRKEIENIPPQKKLNKQKTNIHSQKYSLTKH